MLFGLFEGRDEGGGGVATCNNDSMIARERLGRHGDVMLRSPTNMGAACCNGRKPTAAIYTLWFRRLSCSFVISHILPNVSTHCSNVTENIVAEQPPPADKLFGHRLGYALLLSIRCSTHHPTTPTTTTTPWPCRKLAPLSSSSRLASPRLYSPLPVPY